MEIFKRNYNATVKRGKITPETTHREFFDKFMEEVNELKYEVENCNDLDMFMEIGDCMNVLNNWCVHEHIDIIALLTEIAEKNEKRSNS